MILFWVLIFCLSLAILLKGADVFLRNAEKVGVALGLTPFIVGVTIVAVGTSLPELFSSLASVFANAPQIVAANAIGSNIANILLIVGVSAVLARRLTVTKDLIDLDLPLLAVITALAIGAFWDKVVTVPESILLLLGYIIYVSYTVLHEGSSAHASRMRRQRVGVWTIGMMVIGALALGFGSKYLIDSVIRLSELLGIASGIIAISAVAIGTSLPELVVSAKAALKSKSEIALGNIFGSNVFNTLIVIAVPGLFGALPLDTPTFSVGLPIMALATLLFIFSGISRRIYIWEGAFFLLLYIFFLGKLFALL